MRAEEFVVAFPGHYFGNWKASSGEAYDSNPIVKRLLHDTTNIKILVAVAIFKEVFPFLYHIGGKVSSNSMPATMHWCII